MSKMIQLRNVPDHLHRTLKARAAMAGMSLLDYTLHALDLEVAQVLRRLVRERTVAEHRADEAVQDLVDLRIVRYPHVPLLLGIWRLRHNFSAYDAAYVVLVELLDATLMTRHERLASAPGPHATIELI